MAHFRFLLADMIEQAADIMRAQIERDAAQA